MTPFDVVVDSLRLPFLFLDFVLMTSTVLEVLEPTDRRVVGREEDAGRGSVNGSRAKLGVGVVHMSREGLFAVMTGYWQG